MEQGYHEAQGGGATLIVNLDYGVDNGHEKVVTTPGFGPGYGVASARGLWRLWSALLRARLLLLLGGPFWYQPFVYPQVESYTYYVSHLDMRISRASDGKTLFEGRARARSTSDSLPTLVPNLIEAMFTGFPGRSGEDVLSTVPPPPKSGSNQPPVNR